eukprot:jgi/Mesen1/6044/ME000308S05237
MSSAGKEAGLKLRQAFQHCAQQVRAYDYEHYLCALHLPPAERAAAIALRALNVETSLGAKGGGGAGGGGGAHPQQQQPVLAALSAVTEQRHLSKKWFDRLIQARVDDLEREIPFGSLSALEEYAESTASVLTYLTLQAASVRSLSADHAASHLGKAEGLALVLRGTPLHSAMRRTYLPLDIVAKHGVTQEDLYSRRPSPAVADVATSAYLTALERCNFDVFDPALQRGVCGTSHLQLYFQLWWHKFQKKY